MSRLLISLSAVQTLLLSLSCAKLIALETQIAGVQTASAAISGVAAARDDAPFQAAAALAPADIRKIIREELAAAAKPNALRMEAASAAPADTRAASSKPLVYSTQVRAQLNAYLAKGKMSPREIDDYFDKMAELPEAERGVMLRNLRNAMNSGKLDARM